MQTDTAPASDALDPFLRKHRVVEIINTSDRTLYRWIREGQFPPPVRLGPNSVAWRQSVVTGWQNSRPSAREQAAA